VGGTACVLAGLAPQACDLIAGQLKRREAVINSTLGYSIIRMNKAQPPPEGYEAYHPLP